MFSAMPNSWFTTISVERWTINEAYNMLIARYLYLMITTVSFRPSNSIKHNLIMSESRHGLGMVLYRSQMRRRFLLAVVWRW